MDFNVLKRKSEKNGDFFNGFYFSTKGIFGGAPGES